MRTHKAFTLVEMLVAIALSAIACTLAMMLWYGTFTNARERENRTINGLALQAGVLALSSRLDAAQGLWNVEPNRVVWLTLTGAFDTLALREDTLWLGTRPVVTSCTGLTIRVHGPCWSEEDTAGGYARWNRMDLDRNRCLDEDELDVDYSRSLDEQESGRVATLEIVMEFASAQSVLLRKTFRAGRLLHPNLL